MLSKMPPIKNSTSSLVLTVQPVIAILFGLVTIIYDGWFSAETATSHSNVICKAWGLAIISTSLIAYNARHFELKERVIVCRCMAINYFIQAFVIFYEGPAERDGGKITALTSHATSGLLICCLYNFASFLWASLENAFEKQDYSTLENKQASSWTMLKLTILTQVFIAFPMGTISILNPKGFYTLPKEMLKSLVKEGLLDDLNPTGPLELFAIRCWGSFIIGMGALCIHLLSCSEFSTKSLKTCGTIMIFYFSTLGILFFSQWEQLNIIYQYASVPVFAVMTVLYSTAVAVTAAPNKEATAQKFKTN